MAKMKEWNFTLMDGRPVNVTLIGNKKVSVNRGQEIPLGAIKSDESNFAERIFDVPMETGEVAKLCVTNKQVLVYNGRNVETGMEYAPMKLPAWVYAFVVLYALNLFLGGAIGGALSAVGAYYSARVSADSNKSTGARVGICVAIYLATTALMFVLATIVGVLFGMAGAN